MSRKVALTFVLFFTVLVVSLNMRVMNGNMESDRRTTTVAKEVAASQQSRQRLAEEPAQVTRQVAQDTEEAPVAVASSAGAKSSKKKCFEGPDIPLSTLEEELRRLYELVREVMVEVNATYWPADATLLGLMRNGRVATDRDLDFQIHSTFSQCGTLLASLKSHFAKRAKIKSFKVAYTKHEGRKIGRYVMVRLFRKHGTFDTGADFNCVYTDDPRGPATFTHKGVLTPLPKALFPLGVCSAYGGTVPCPGDGYAFLQMLKPRYDGCMVYPHCFGNPETSVKKCLTPYPTRPLSEFPSTIDKLDACGFVSLKAHKDSYTGCEVVARGEQKRCETIGDSEYCFLQSFKG